MKRGTLILAGAALSLVLGAGAFGFSIVGERQAPATAARTPKLAAEARTLDEACSSATTYERLKTKVFDAALDVGDVDPAKLDLLAGSTVVRMEDPILKAKDEELGVTVCAGRFVVELPPGAEKAFDGRRRLEAEIEYAAQVAADGSGMVYQLRGAEPITYRLAAFDLQGLPPLAPVEATSALAAAEPILMAPEPVTVPAAVIVPPAVSAKPVPELPVVAERTAEPVKVAKPAAAAKPKVKAAPALVKPPVRTAAKHEAKPTVKVARAEPKPKAAEKVATSKALKIAGRKPTPSTKTKPAVKLAAAKTKPMPMPKVRAKPAVQVAAAKPKHVPVKVKPPVRVATALKPAPKVQLKAGPANKPAVQRASISTRNFACGAGRPLSERLMCANPALGAKERRMMGVYYSALDNADGATRRVLQDTAGDFQAYRNNCRTESCLSGAFDERVAEIRDILADMR